MSSNNNNLNLFSNNTLTRSSNNKSNNKSSSKNSNKTNKSVNKNSNKNNKSVNKNSMKNNKSKSSMLGNNSNTMISIFIIIIILVILYFIGRFFYNYYQDAKPKFTRKFLVDGMVDGKSEFVISASDMPTGLTGVGYSISFWIIVNDYKNYRYGKNKVILRRGSVKGDVNPEIYLHPFDNTLQVNVSNLFKKSESTTTTVMSTESTTPPETTTPETTTPETTTAADAASFVNIPNDSDIEGFTTCNCDEMTTNKQITNFVDQNKVQQLPDYNDDFFSLIQGNQIDSKLVSHNKNQNNVMEEFYDSHPSTETTPTNDNSEVCDCSEGVTVTDEDRTTLEEDSSTLKIPDFPLQTPVHIVLSLHNNQVLDVYINGKLNKMGSKHIDAPETVLDDLILGPDGGFDGKIGNLFYFNNPLSSNEVRNLYHRGMNYTPGFFSKIPTYVYVIAILIIIFAIVYSTMM